MLQLLERLANRPKPGQVDLLVDDGVVGCPNSASNETAIDVCLACPRLLKYVEVDGKAWVRCTPAVKV